MEMRLDRRLSIAALALTLMVMLVTMGVVGAKKPLYGQMTLGFNTAWFGWGPQTQVPDWVGTIEIDGETYGMLFFAFASGKPFETDPPGKVHFFEEIWAIYEEVPPAIPEGDEGVWVDWLPSNPDPAVGLIMWGYDRGVTTQNSKYHMTGNVEEAFGDFAEWEGRQVYMRGIIEWAEPGIPESAPGTLRLD
jgi:hypothetical protein